MLEPKNDSKFRFLKVLFIMLLVMGAGLLIQTLPSFFKKDKSGVKTEAPLSSESLQIDSSAIRDSEQMATAIGQPEDSAAVSKSLSEADSKRLSLLKEILRSKNDNDPRLDTEFKVLSPALKQALRTEYQQTVPEKLNDRGTIVFLLGRNLQTEEDFQFMKSVIESPSCKSFSDCTKDSTQFAEEDHHHEAGDAITLSYPQWNAFLAIESWINRNEFEKLTQAQKNYFGQVIDSAMRSSNLTIASRARSLQDQIRQ